MEPDFALAFLKHVGMFCKYAAPKLPLKVLTAQGHQTSDRSCYKTARTARNHCAQAKVVNLAAADIPSSDKSMDTMVDEICQQQAKSVGVTPIKNPASRGFLLASALPSQVEQTSGATTSGCDNDAVH